VATIRVSEGAVPVFAAKADTVPAFGVLGGSVSEFRQLFIGSWFFGIWLGFGAWDLGFPSWRPWQSWPFHSGIREDRISLQADRSLAII